MGYIWPDTHTNALLASLEGGATFAKTASSINEMFGTAYTPAAIWGRASRLNLPTLHPANFWPEPHKARLVELYNEKNGLSFAKMAAIINGEFNTSYSRASVIGQARRLELKGKEEPVSERRAPRKLKPRPVVEKPSQEYPPLRCVEIIPRNLTLAELDMDADCHWIAGDDGLYCGHPVKTGYPYCPSHVAIAYTPAKAAERKYTKFHGTDFAKRSA